MGNGNEHYPEALPISFFDSSNQFSHNQIYIELKGRLVLVNFHGFPYCPLPIAYHRSFLIDKKLQLKYHAT